MKVNFSNCKIAWEGISNTGEKVYNEEYVNRLKFEIEKLQIENTKLKNWNSSFANNVRKAIEDHIL